MTAPLHVVPAAAPAAWSAPTVSIVVCTYSEERWADLVRAVQSCVEQDVAALEVIVVVDHDRPLLRRVGAELPEVLALASAGPPGLSAARNTGVAAARGEVVAFLDDDAVASPRWLAVLADAYRDPAVVGAGGTVVANWPGRRPAWFPREFDWVVGCSYRGLPTVTATVRNPIGANMSFRRDVLQREGGFTSGIGRVGRRPVGCEETELSIRVCQRRPGTRIAHVPEAAVRHRVEPARTAPRYFASRCFSEGLSKAIVARHVGAGDGLAAERAHVVRQLSRGAFRGVRDGLGGEPAGFARTVAIAAGLLLTTAGYLAGASGPLRSAGSRPLRRSAEEPVAQGDDARRPASRASSGHGVDRDERAGIEEDRGLGAPATGAPQLNRVAVSVVEVHGEKPGTTAPTSSNGSGGPRWIEGA